MSLMIIEIFVILARIRFSAYNLYYWLAICKKTVHCILLLAIFANVYDR